MEITIKVSGQALYVTVTVEVYEYLDQAAHKDENLDHELCGNRAVLWLFKVCREG